MALQRKSLPSIALSVLAILACGGIGAFAGFGLARWIGLAGTPAALVAVVAGMFVAAIVFAVGAALLRRIGAIRG